MSDNDKAPRAIGSFDDHLKGVTQIRRVHTTFGEKNPKGDRFADLPPWFAYAGLKSFTINTGFGVVRCTAPGAKARRVLEAADEAHALALDAWSRSRKKGADGPEGDGSPETTAALKEAETRRDAARVTYALYMVTELPQGWVNEGDEVRLSESTIVKHGDPLPAPSTVAALPVSAQEEYEAMLPPALLGQVYSGWVLLQQFPPIAFAEDVLSPS